MLQRIAVAGAAKAPKPFGDILLGVGVLPTQDVLGVVGITRGVHLPPPLCTVAVATKAERRLRRLERAPE